MGRSAIARKGGRVLAVQIDLSLPVSTGANGCRPISPTDISQFIRLEQCQRYLRLRLHERTVNAKFMADYGVVPQSLPPLLTRSGADFEQAVELAVAARFKKINLVNDVQREERPADDNRQVADLARALAPGDVIVLFQPRLEAELAGWRIRGDIDIVRLECDGDGTLHVLIADMKSSTATKVEHRLQVAFYHEMLAAIFDREGIAYDRIDLAILYRGPADDDQSLSEADAAEREAQRRSADVYFGTEDGLLEIIADPESYLESVRDLVTGPDSTALRVSQAEFATIPYHLTYKCDGCLYNEFCMKWSAERDDLSLLPHLTAREKQIVRRAGIGTVRELATLKEFRKESPDTPAYWSDLVPVLGKEAIVQQLAAIRPVGPRLDELVHRARWYRKRWKHDPIDVLPAIPSKGYGSLPYCAAEHNPNLVYVYIDVQHDYLNDRVYMLGALVDCRENGIEQLERRRSIVYLAEEPPRSSEEEARLFVHWITGTLQAIVELAAPDSEGNPRAPIHLVFYSRFEQKLLLDGLARHADTILGGTALYDFLTQRAAFDSPVASFLDEEIRELKNYPMVCQSLQAVAAYLKFDWNAPEPYREIFRTRLFDFWSKLEPDAVASGESPWYTSRSRFNSQIPLEYAYAAWGELDRPEKGRDDYASYRQATPDLLRGFQARRLEALEQITHDFPGNRQTEKTAFDLPELAGFDEQARTLAQALDEFVTIERHVDLNAWKSARLAPPERRALSGDTLLVRYLEADQDPEVAERNRKNERLRRLREEYEQAYLAANPDADKPQLTKEQKKETEWSQDGMRFRLRLECAGIECGLDELLSLTAMKAGDLLILNPRTTVDSRLPVEEQTEFTPTPKQMLYGTRAELLSIDIERDASGRAHRGYIDVRIRDVFGGDWSRGFVFSAFSRPLDDGRCYTLDPDPNDFYGYWCAKVTGDLCAIEAGQKKGHNTLYDRLIDPLGARVKWPPEAATGQHRFLEGLDALHQVGALNAFEPGKREFIGSHGDAPILPVQGPPGTGKSYSTAFALFARLQGAIAAGRDFRAFVSCKTHAATDVLLKNVAQVQARLRDFRSSHPEIFATYFDARLLDVPLYRFRPKGDVPDGVIALRRKEDLLPGMSRAVETILARQWCVVAATPGGIYGMTKEKWSGNLFGHDFCDCLILDEASQLNLAEAIMAGLPLKPDGQVIVVGDHRQMPPIIKHDWNAEPRRTFKQFRAYESLFLALQPLGLPAIRFQESFRLHADMAEFLRREIYQQDGIPYFSRKREVLPAFAHPDPFIASVLTPEHPLIVVVHSEAESQLRNPFEQALIAPILEALADPRAYGYGPERGLGVVVPHRAQRAALREAVPQVTKRDPGSGLVIGSSVDTVERFQGDERTVILVSATESDREYLLASSEFLLDPRRLTVALSRAKRKMILVASESVFGLFSPDEEVFANAQLWKNLLRRTCTVELWQGERHGWRVQVWGNAVSDQ